MHVQDICKLKEVPIKLKVLCLGQRFLIISLWDLLVAMVTTILIQSASKHYVVNPLNQTILGIIFDQHLTAVQNDIKIEKV